MDTYKYWNNIEVEKKKPFWVEDISDKKLMLHLREETNLERCFLDALSFAKDIGYLGGNILDIGAGVGWSSAIVSKIPSVNKVIATDFSLHRLTKTAPIVFKQLKGDIGKLKIIPGNFLQLKWEPESFNVVIFVQSLYMFSNLATILKKVNQYLVPRGLLIVACERVTPEYRFFSLQNFKKRIRFLLRGRMDISGYHGYLDNEYRRSIRNADFRYLFQDLDYPVFPKENDWKAGNYFGIKVTNEG